MKEIQLKFDEKGLIPAVVQDIATGDVLMLAYMNEKSLNKTLETGFAHYWSRSRECLWMKGETSGNTQEVQSIYYDCDKDALLLKVKQKGNACHTGNRTCFYRKINRTKKDITQVDSKILYELYKVVENRREQPIEGSYTNYLFNEGIDKILKKVGEEATEVVIGAKNDSKDELIYEVSDLIYHLVVLLVNQDVKLDDIFAELKSRRTEDK